MMSSNRLAMTVSIAGALALAASAGATVTVSDPFLVITATQGPLTGSFVVPLNDPNIFIFNDSALDYWEWQIGGPVAITSGTTLLGVVAANTGVIANRSVQPDGSVRWGLNGAFNVTSGAAETSFTISFPTLSLGTAVADAQLQASAGLVGTDQAQGSQPDPNDGIFASGNYAAGGAFRAFYNGGTVFREYLVGPQGNPLRGQSFGVDGNMNPPGSFESVAPVTDFTASYNFNLSAFDQAAGTFDVTLLPAPGAASLLALGGLLLGRRRR